MHRLFLRWRTVAIVAPLAVAALPLLATEAAPISRATCSFEIASLTPSSVVAGSGQFDLDVALTSAASQQATVLFDGELVSTSSPSNTVLRATIPGELLETPRTLDVVVACGSGNETPAAVFTVEGGGPTVDNIVPSSIVAGRAGFILTVNGAGFSENSAITWNGTPLDTTYADDPTKLYALVSSELIADRFPTPTIDIAVISVGEGTQPAAAAPGAVFTILRSSSDVDCGGEAEVLDALFLMRYLAGLQEESACSTNADLSRDGLTTLADVMHIRLELAGLLPEPGPLASTTQP